MSQDSSASGKAASRNPWAWVPTLYLAQGLPFAVVNSVSVLLYKSLGISNTDIAFYTAWLYLPWVIKPLWSPVVDILRTRRWWIWATQLLLGAGFASVALTLPTEMFFKASLAVFYLVAFSSATHDIAADGYYLLALTEKQQTFFVGIRSTFFRISMIFGQGLLVILAGLIQSNTGLPMVSISVDAKPGVSLVESILPVGPGKSEASAVGDLVLVTDPTQLQIAPQPRTKSEIAPLLAAAKTWNTDNGFYRVRQQAKAQDKKDDSKSWWTRTVSEPFAGWLKNNFGRTAVARSDVSGNIGVVSLHLSKPPGREVVVTPAFAAGDKSISLAEGARLVFDDSNWNKPALVVIQLDPKLKSETRAVFAVRSGNIPLSWTVTMFVLAAMFLGAGLWHKFILPRPAGDKPGDTQNIPAFITEFFKTFGSFFRKPKIVVLLLFLLLYRFGEAQLVKMVQPFLLDAREVGGLGLTTGQVGIVYGTIGILALTLGGLLGGMVASRQGLKFWLWPMVLIIHLPDAAFIYLAHAQPDNFAVISAAVAVEQFGYGFGFTAFMLYMIYIARGEHRTAHYAICTGFMALGMMLPGMWSGWLQEIIGYTHFFTWVILATVPSFIVVMLIPLDAEFGKKA
ncbi:MAG: MFS transporter [Verrucomicrobia bacterium]|nr:MFS transporter [Verrucomicrobiota bacterium]